MTNILLRYLKIRYKPIEDLHYSDISPYEANERIYFIFNHKKYLSQDQVITEGQIKDIASKVFTDVGWEFHPIKGLHQNLIKFYIKELEKTKDEDKNYEAFLYESNYGEHDIEFGKLNNYLHITISTGNRGRAVLDKRQRKQYALFLDMIIEQTIINTK